jgi:hypothetical protein
MQIALKLRPKGKKSPIDAVRETIDAVRPELGMVADVREVFPGVTSGNRAGMVTVRLAASESDANAVLQALQARDDVIYAEPVATRSSR